MKKLAAIACSSSRAPADRGAGANRAL